ncbi:lipid-A-disaccharide synthase [Stappia sp. MMSF_3263]|uniref:lipid-A-disaccharide synthase n=1 Tax=Stappia sp. MMSF_3263 TaxID=3046693 RepID=UPI00273E5685|nr:lipid-A-disaccharide synthase [Stappia sp. MMSF_3263]
MSDTAGRPLLVYMIVGEESGDQLAAPMMQSLRARTAGNIRFQGVGGERMEREGLESLFPIEDIAVMGLSAVLGRLPLIVKRVYQSVDDVVAADPDLLVIIDSPDFTHNVARRVRKRAPHIPIVGYVSPSVWAWRPGRARRMAAYVDHLLAILPFEPAVHRRLGGPPTSFVGHSIIQRAGDFRPAPGERSEPGAGTAPVLLVLPGSRRSEVTRLLADFRGTVDILKAERPDLRVLLPAVPRLLPHIEQEVAHWRYPPEIVTGEAGKLAAFRCAHAALAASGTVSLELAISGVPMAIAYKLDWFYRRIKDLNRFLPIASVTSMVLPNIILGENVVPEFLDDDANPRTLADAVRPLLADSPQRRVQVEAFARLDEMMRLPSGAAQADEAARVALGLVQNSINFEKNSA